MKPCWLGYIFAADVDKAAAQLQQLGGTIHREATDIPNVGKVRRSRCGSRN